LIAVIAAGASRSAAHLVLLQGSRIADLESLALATLVWTAVAGLGLWLFKARLPHDLRRQTDRLPGRA
jgi:hypothetical protein